MRDLKWMSGGKGWKAHLVHIFPWISRPLCSHIRPWHGWTAAHPEAPKCKTCLAQAEKRGIK